MSSSTDDKMSLTYHTENVYCAFHKQAENYFMNSCSAVCREKFREHLIGEVIYSLIVMLYDNEPYDIDRHCEGLWEDYCIINGIDYIHDDFDWWEGGP